MRTQTQIQSTLGDTLGPVYYSSADSGLISYWRFDKLEDLGINGDGADDVRDYSIFDNHADLVGDATLDTSGIVTGIDPDYTGYQPKGFILLQNYPNPFNPSTTIRFEMPVSAQVDLRVYNLLGQEVAVLIDNEELSSGVFKYNFNASRLPSGVYFYRIITKDFVQTKKMVLLK